MDWEIEIVAVAAMLVAVLGFLWNLHRDVRNLSERQAADMRELSERIGVLSERHVADMHGLSERLATDMRAVSERIAGDMRGLSERIARVEGLLAGMNRTMAPAGDRAETPA